MNPTPTIFHLVKKDLDGRESVGLKTYGGGGLLATTAKDWLKEAYDESLDLAVYLRGELAKRERVRALHRRYNKSKKGCARMLRYNKSATARARNNRYHRSAKGKARTSRYRSQPRVKENHKWTMRSLRRKQKIQANAL